MTTVQGFEIKYVFLAYVPPYEEADKSNLQTETLKKESKTTDYLFKIFDSSIDEAKVEILFTPNQDNQSNIIRDNVLAIVQKEQANHKASYAKNLANALHAVTDERNGNGLFVIIEGQKAKTTRIVLMRFKGDEGLINHGKKLLINYISEVFTKRSHHYKLAVYEDIVSKKSFWKGYSIDKQLKSSTYKPISFFWIEKFLLSETALTPAQGTLQFSKIMKSLLSKSTDVEEQEQIISAVINLRAKKNIQISVADFCDSYLSSTLTQKIKDELQGDDFFNSVFQVDTEVYKKEFGKTVLSLEDGITAYVPTFNYEKHVKEKLNNDGSKSVVIEAKLHGKKINVQQQDSGNERKSARSKK